MNELVAEPGIALRIEQRAQPVDEDRRRGGRCARRGDTSSRCRRDAGCRHRPGSVPARSRRVCWQRADPKSKLDRMAMRRARIGAQRHDAFDRSAYREAAVRHVSSICGARWSTKRCRFISSRLVGKPKDLGITSRCVRIDVHASKACGLGILAIWFGQLDGDISLHAQHIRQLPSSSAGRRSSMGCARLNCTRCGRIHTVPSPSVTEQRTVPRVVRS